MSDPSSNSQAENATKYDIDGATSLRYAPCFNQAIGAGLVMGSGFGLFRWMTTKNMPKLVTGFAYGTLLGSGVVWVSCRYKYYQKREMTRKGIYMSLERQRQQRLQAAEKRKLEKEGSAPDEHQGESS